MRSTRGLALTPVVSAIACVLAVSGGIAWGRHHPAAPVAAVTTHGEWVKFANAHGDSVRAYVAYPERRDKAPAIIVIHEIFGMTAWEPTVADKFAARGYVAIAPDLLSSRYGMSPSTDDSSRKLVATLSDAGVMADLDAAYKYVNALTATQSGNTGIIGFCWGGGTVYKYAAANPAVKAAVACYGPVNDTSALAPITAPVFAVDAEKDDRVTGALPGITAFMANHHKPFESKVYPGMGHGFLKPPRPGSDSPTADQARADIDAYFAKHLDHK
jgi:carboxymethylenebutenolidase